MSGTAREDDASAVVEDYFVRLAAAAAAVRAPLGSDDLVELRAHVRDRLSGTTGTAADARRVLAELGPPERLARAFADASDEVADGDAGGARRGTSLVGRVLGMPYDVRTPTSDRIASRVWDPSNPHVLVPKALGLGWTVNFGALAVKARLVRPDDEDAPFAAAPAGVVAATLAAPAVVVVVLGVLVATRWSRLPATVPTHWDALGRVNGYSGRGSAVVLLGVLAVVPLLLATWVHVRRRRAVNRVAASAVSLGFAVIALAIFGQTLVSLGGGRSMWPTWVGIVAFVVLPFLLLVGVSRLGRAAEQRRDLNLSKGRAR